MHTNLFDPPVLFIGSATDWKALHTHKHQTIAWVYEDMRTLCMMYNILYILYIADGYVYH